MKNSDMNNIYDIDSICSEIKPICVLQFAGVGPGESSGSAVQVSASRKLCDWGYCEHGKQPKRHHHDAEEDSGQWAILPQQVLTNLGYLYQVVFISFLTFLD